MRIKVLFQQFSAYLYNYNLFIPEDTQNEDDTEEHGLLITIKHQKYSTWLYVFFLNGMTQIFFVYS